MRLKHLTLTGYKTFASRSHFEFGEGITAIIGPNGSGKSNIADSIRWALGEQQFSLLRGKKTDDMIFAGSAKRPRASMAEVILTFDNSDGFFPIEFNEIAIGRRAYRDGANEYLLNGNRVRLRDITDLLGHTGLAERTYTVIGQGLVDSALSQRPEERRALFEEAAGIATYRNRRDDALTKLDETRRNLDRVRDILAEITPRLQTLERQAERARKHQSLAAELAQHTRTWFSYHYHRVRAAVAESTRRCEQAQAMVEAAHQAIHALDAELAGLRARQAELRADVSEREHARRAARQTAEECARELAVWRERARAVEAQRAEAQAEFAARTAALDELALRAAHASAVLAGAQALLVQRERELELAQALAAESQAARANLERDRETAQHAVLRASAGAAEARNRLQVARQRQHELATQLAEHTRRVASVGAQRDETEVRLAALDQELDKNAQHLHALQKRCDTLTQELETARAALGAAQSALAAAEAEEKMVSRVSLFAEMRAQQSAADLPALAHAADLPGARGALSALIHSAPDDKKAVEAALGQFAEALVMDGEGHITPLRAWLASHSPQAGRLAVLPLAALRPIHSARQDLNRVLSERAHQLSARRVLDAIQSPPWLQPALQAILDCAFITRDLQTARALAAELPADGLCVTRDGEIVFASGALSLPAGPRSPIILGAEDPASTHTESDGPEAFSLITPEEARANRARAVEARDAAQHHLETCRRALDEANRARESFVREMSARRAARDDVARRLNALEEQLALMAGDIARVEQQQAELDSTLDALTDELSRAQADEETARHTLGGIEQRLREHLASGWMEPLNAAFAAMATAGEAVRSAEALRRERLAALDDSVRRRERDLHRLMQLDEQCRSTQEALETARLQAAQADEAVYVIEADLAPAQAELEQMEQSVLDVDRRRRQAEQALREANAALNAVTLELAHHQDELETLRERAADAFQDEDVQEGAEGAQFSFASRERALTLLESLEPATELPAGVEERITQLRNQIRRLGAINFEAQREFDELKQRHAFLSEQVADLEQAIAGLKQVIAELNEVMQATFRQTFDAIAAAFQTTFKLLFGGGQAKLSLVNAENLDEAGVEIHAQPPGKRAQPLALLSGGERSLTATALLFAILRVKPTPFCVLDEVDAALDEANVGRFRSMLESLAHQTQFIVITHNRRTVEAANTIYGISMGADGASAVLSLRLEEVNA
ncbi:MAG: chromosome segregation protein SMC [Anaerolineae bacterium]|nr:chromosome segregation protein SMC [Thermoflexales bacterium]MDW8406282.1 chromosome segregation protein SMC [Anaerolineae bacterium]